MGALSEFEPNVAFKWFILKIENKKLSMQCYDKERRKAKQLKIVPYETILLRVESLLICVGKMISGS